MNSSINTQSRNTPYYIWFSISVFVLSLPFETYCTSSGCGSGWANLAFGFLGVFFGGATLTWLANPLLITAWILAKRNPLWAWRFSVVASIIAFSFMFFGEIIDNEAGHYHTIESYGSAYWLWLLSCSIMSIVGFFDRRTTLDIFGNTINNTSI